MCICLDVNQGGTNRNCCTQTYNLACQGGYVIASVCPGVCLFVCEQDRTESFQVILCETL